MVTKSEIRKLEHQGTKYENNEAYEQVNKRLHRQIPDCDSPPNSEGQNELERYRRSKE